MLLRHVNQQRSHDNVHGLAVAQFAILPAVGDQNAAQCGDALVGLVRGIFGQRAIQIFLDFFHTGIGLTLVLLENRRILAAVRQALENGATRDLPQLAAQHVRQSYLHESRELRVTEQRDISTMCGEVLLPEPHFALVLELFRISRKTKGLAKAHFVRHGVFAMLAFGVLVTETQQRLAVASIQERS